jgi:hypothetical protein
VKVFVRYFLPIFAALCAVNLFDGNLEGNELDTLANALHRVAPSFIPNDFRLSMSAGPRLPFQLVLAPLLHVCTMMQVSIIGRLALYALLAGAYTRLARKIGLDVVEALACGAIWVLIGFDVVTGEFVVVGVESKALAYAGVLWALDCAMDRRWARAGACLGLAVTMHPAVGAWSSIAVLVAFWRPPKEAWRALPVFAVTAAPGIVLSLPSFAHTAHTALGTWLYVYFRHPHHLVPSCFAKWPDRALRVAMAVIVWALSFRVRFTAPAERVIARFAQAAMAFFVAGMAASAAPHAERFLYTYPFRVGDTLFPLFALMLIARRALPNHLSRRAQVISLVVIALLSAEALRRDFTQDRQWAAAKPRPAYEWVKHHTPKDALVLCAAGLDYAGLYMERPTVASMKAVPTVPENVARWYERIVDLNGGVPTVEQGFAAFDELETDFENLPAAKVEALVAKYDARYVLWPTGGNALPYAKIYDDGVWTVLEVSRDPRGGARAR